LANHAIKVERSLPFLWRQGRCRQNDCRGSDRSFLLNQLKRNESILLFSTDPAHSLSDSLDVKIGNRLVEVKQLRGARLFAYEMDASLALERFREAHGKVLAEIAERGTLLDEEDIKELLSLSLPGLMK
jgi:arsenite-transporting ATPase